MEQYTYSVEWLGWGRKYSGKCSEYPSLCWFAETEEKALEGIKHIIAVIENQFVETQAQANRRLNT
jgi:predicted RNase H-like HicB family nuclease